MKYAVPCAIDLKLTQLMVSWSNINFYMKLNIIEIISLIIISYHKLNLFPVF